jgi:hypothetical protein
MKIEIGESLIYSWLRHYHNCQICQTNWKTSQKWNVDENDKIECQILMDESSKIFGNIFKETKNIDQLIKQCEIDILGINTFNSKVFAVDIAYHSGGLGYKDSINVVTKKILRTVFALKLYFKDVKTFNIYFISPIIGKKLNDQLVVRVNEIINYLESKDLKFNIELLSNDKFKNEVLNPILKISNDVADMSELFLRSHQLISLFENQMNLTSMNKIKKQNELDNELAIGEFAQNAFKTLIKNNKLDSETINKLQSLEYCRSVFGMNFQILKKINDKNNIREERQINGYPRYYAQPINAYLLCNDWYERHRDTLNQWLLEINK